MIERDEVYRLGFKLVLWGIVGMLLATPITAVLKIMLERYELTRPVARLMAGRLGETAVIEKPAAVKEGD